MPAELSQLTERFGELCAEAAQHTDAKIVYELMPFDVNVNSLDAVLQVVGGAGAANGGIAIDTWHMSKLGIEPDDLRRIPIEYLSWVELSDGRLDDMDDLVDETVNHRALPGEGEFDVRGVRRGLPGPRLPRALGRRGALRGAAQQSDRRDLPARLRDDRRPIRTREELRMSATSGVEELDRDRLVWMYEQMLRIREFEERVKRTFVEHPGVIRGHTHLADGAEASIVGSIATLGPEDQFFATYRCHGYPLARGTDPKAMMAEIYGRKDGLCKGIGGSMHLTDVSQRASSARPGSSRPGSRTPRARPGRRRSASRARSSSASSATAPPSRARSRRR